MYIFGEKMKKRSKKKKSILSKIKWTCKEGIIENNKCQDCGQY